MCIRWGLSKVTSNQTILDNNLARFQPLQIQMDYKNIHLNSNCLISKQSKILYHDHTMIKIVYFRAIPSSFKGIHGNITYTISATILVNDDQVHSVEREIQVMAPLEQQFV